MTQFVNHHLAPSVWEKAIPSPCWYVTAALSRIPTGYPYFPSGGADPGGEITKMIF